jgi:hypothetical protein
MSELIPTDQPSKLLPEPQVVYGEGVDTAISVSAESVTQDMQGLNISEQGVDNTTVYMDPKNRLLNLGTHYYSWMAPIRFPHIPELRNAKGDIVRISTEVKGQKRTVEQMNHTLTHELEHVAQHDRHDRKVIAGHTAIWGLAAAGAIAGNRLGRGKVSKTVGTVLGGLIGQQTGYMIAPHERQARKRARQVTSSAISHK